MENPSNTKQTILPPLAAPPVNDCCPICFDDFTVPCRSNCHHWFCASCILEFWHYGASLQPCKCPFCFTRITTLTPQPTLLSSKESATAALLRNVHKYNSLYAGGASAFIMKVCLLPSMIKRGLLDMSEPARQLHYYRIVRVIALFLSIIYMACSFDFLPKGYLSTPRFFELCGIIFMCFIHLFGILHSYWRRRHVRNLAAFPQDVTKD